MMVTYWVFTGFLTAVITRIATSKVTHTLLRSNKDAKGIGKNVRKKRIVGKGWVEGKKEKGEEEIGRERKGE